MADPLPIVPFTAPASGQAQVPGSKSITNRALALAALCQGEIAMEGALFSRDTRIMIAALRELGLDIRPDEQQARISLSGSGSSFPCKSAEIHVGNAGTAARILTALLAFSGAGEYHLDGDEPMRERPMKGLTDALAHLGVQFSFHQKEGYFPFTLSARELVGDTVRVDASASSQLLSAILIAAAGSGRAMTVELAGSTVSHPFIEMTLRMLTEFGVTAGRPSPSCFSFAGGSGLSRPSGTYMIEPDASAASYFLALPLAVGGQIEVHGLNRQMLQGDIDFVDVLTECGLRSDTTSAGIRTCATEQAKGGDWDFTAISDTFLTLAAISPLLQGSTLIRGIAHTRHQETDRIAAMATELKKLHQDVTELPDSLQIKPNLPALKELAAKAAESGQLIEIDTYEDHRVAMSFAILGSADLAGDGRPWLAIRNPSCCGKTFPGFFDELEKMRAFSQARASSAPLS